MKRIWKIFPNFFPFFFPKNFKKKKRKKKGKKRSKKTQQTPTLLLWISFVSIIRESTKKEARFFLPFVCVCRDDDADPKDDDLYYTTRQRRSRAFEEREREKENFFLEFFKNKISGGHFDWKIKALCVCTLIKEEKRRRRIA